MMLGTEFAGLTAAAALCLTLAIRWWGVRNAAREPAPWLGVLIDLIVSLLLASAVFFAVWAVDSATIQWTGISDDGKFLLALVALTLTLLSGIAIKVARDATQDVKDTAKNIQELRDEIHKKQETREESQLRLLGMVAAIAQRARAVQYKEHRDIPVWELILSFYEAADPQASTFSERTLRNKLLLLASSREVCRMLTETDLTFIGRLAKGFVKNYPGVAEAARELLRQSSIR